MAAQHPTPLVELAQKTLDRVEQLVASCELNRALLLPEAVSTLAGDGEGLLAALYAAIEKLLSYAPSRPPVDRYLENMGLPDINTGQQSYRPAWSWFGKPFRDDFVWGLDGDNSSSRWALYSKPVTPRQWGCHKDPWLTDAYQWIYHLICDTMLDAANIAGGEMFELAVPPYMRDHGGWLNLTPISHDGSHVSLTVLVDGVVACNARPPLNEEGLQSRAAYVAPGSQSLKWGCTPIGGSLGTGTMMLSRDNTYYTPLGHPRHPAWVGSDEWLGDGYGIAPDRVRHWREWL